MAEYTEVFPYRSEIQQNILIDSEVYSEKLVLTKDNMPAGTYLVSLSMSYSNPDLNDSFYYRATRDIATGVEITKEAKDSDDVYATTIMVQHTHPGGTIDVGVEMRKEDAGALDVTVLNAGIFIRRVA